MGQLLDTHHKPPYPPRKPTKAMTIAASFRFGEGVLLCADRLITHGTAKEPGSFASYQEKIWELTRQGFSLAMTGAGTTAALKAIADKVMATIQNEQEYFEDTSLYQLPTGIAETALKDAVDEVYESLDPQTDSADMILAVNEYVSGFIVVRNTGRIVSKIETSDIVGVGESSLLDFLKGNLYQSCMTETEVTAFAVLFVHAAKTYCPQYCGGQTDIKILKRGFRGVLTIPAATVDHLESFFRQETKACIRNLLDRAIQSLT